MHADIHRPLIEKGIRVSAPYQLFDILPAHIEDALRASIRRFGVLVPVVRDQHGNTIDGHHRARLADELGVGYRVDVREVADADEAREIARTLNSDRRHLTDEQRRAVAAELRHQGHSYRAIGGALGVSHTQARHDVEAARLESTFQSEPERVTRRGGGSYPARRPDPAPMPEPEPLPTPDPTADTVACEACGTQLPDDQAAAGYMRCEDCDSEGDHYAATFPKRGGPCVVCHGRPDDDDQPEPETTPPAAKPQPAPEPQWSDDELALRAELEAGRTIVVSLRAHHANLVRWADQAGLLVRIDRRTDWGNPFETPADGDRTTVIRNYGEHYLPYKPSLLDRIESLAGKALACWCAPDDCHGDVLKEATEQ